ncbi:MAG: serine hydrolase domain-containing protein [Gemmatimonadales bacterium]
MKRCVPLAIALIACAPEAAPPNPGEAVAGRLGQLLDSVKAANPSVPGVMLRVEAPSLELSFSRAAGVSDLASGTPLDAGQTVRIASNTKTYVAAAVLRLVEEGRIGLDDEIARHLLPASTATLKRGGYDPSAITVRMLLQHTSGIADFATAPTGSVTERYGAYMDYVLSDPTRRLTRADQLELAMKNGPAYGAQDEVYHYSDTGYILLGEILEIVTGRPMSVAVRELLGFDRLGIRATWFESLDSVPTPAPPRAHQYLDTLDGNGLDPSFDLYGGGGIVSTLEDMAIFYRALVRGEILGRPLLDSMLAVSPQSRTPEGTGYGMGIGQRSGGEVACWGHTGFWGTAAFHCPSVDLTVTAAVTTTEARPAMLELTEAVSRAVLPSLTASR